MAKSQINQISLDVPVATTNVPNLYTEVTFEIDVMGQEVNGVWQVVISTPVELDKWTATRVAKHCREYGNFSKVVKIVKWHRPDVKDMYSLYDAIGTQLLHDVTWKREK